MEQFQSTNNQGRDYLSINTKYVGVVYRDKKKHQHLFVGKVTRRVLHEKDSAAAALGLECLKKKHGVTANILEVVPSHLNKGIDVFALHDVISKQLTVMPKTCGKMEFPEYLQLCDTFNTLKNIDRGQIRIFASNSENNIFIFSLF